MLDEPESFVAVIVKRLDRTPGQRAEYDYVRIRTGPNVLFQPLRAMLAYQDGRQLVARIGCLRTFARKALHSVGDGVVISGLTRLPERLGQPPPRRT